MGAVNEGKRKSSVENVCCDVNQQASSMQHTLQLHFTSLRVTSGQSCLGNGRGGFSSRLVLTSRIVEDHVRRTLHASANYSAIFGSTLPECGQLEENCSRENVRSCLGQRFFNNLGIIAVTNCASPLKSHSVELRATIMPKSSSPHAIVLFRPVSLSRIPVAPQFHCPPSPYFQLQTA